MASSLRLRRRTRDYIDLMLASRSGREGWTHPMPHGVNFAPSGNMEVIFGPDPKYGKYRFTFRLIELPGTSDWTRISCSTW
jgi:hypothetical protein